MAHILLLNVHSSRNAGDAALAEVCLRQIRQYFPGRSIVLAMDDPTSHTGPERTVGSLFTWLKAGGPDGKTRWVKINLVRLLPASLLPVLTFRLWKRPVYFLTPPPLRDLVQSILEAELIASAPGGFLYSSGSGLTLLLIAYSIFLASLAGKPAYMFPQSVGPFRRSWECRLVRGLLSCLRVVQVREPVSLEQLERCGLSHPRCHLLPDLAFAFAGAPLQEAEAWLEAQSISPSRDRPLLGVTLINWGAQNLRFNLQEDYEVAVAGAVRDFIARHGGRALFIPQVWGPHPSQDDRLPARRVADRLKDCPGRVLVVEEPLPPRLLKAVYGRMDVFIGTRMHSNIFALSEGVPVIAIGYQQKTRGILRMAGLEEWMIDIEDIDQEGLIQKLAALWEKRGQVREALLEKIPELARQADRAGALIAEDYEKTR